MNPLLGLLLFPLAWPFIAKRIWHTSINWTEMVIQIVSVCILVAVTYQLGIYGQTVDTEIWNGQITKKEVNDGHYTTSYQCNCRSTSCGKDCTTTTCDTCYEDHYTRSYDGFSTAGNFTFDSIDTTSRMRRNAFGPPAAYTNCVIGEPASLEHTYTNYVQAVPESLFHDDSAIDTYANDVPAYPVVYNHYKIGRILQVGTSYKYAGNLNDQLNNALRTLGPEKQSNIIVILTEIDDPSYRYAVERTWLGGKKNDIVVFIGLDGTTITWVDVMTWALNSGNELFHVTLRDELLALKTIDYVDDVSLAVVDNVAELYDRPQMKDYEYLKDAIEPPTWVLLLAIFFAIGGSIGLTFVFHKYEVDDFIGDLFRKRNKHRRPFR